MGFSLFFILINFFSFQNENTSNFENQFKSYYNKASIAAFYSGSFQNGFHELELTKAYIDSASVFLNKIPNENINKISYLNQLNVLIHDYEVSLKISEDNINYILPSFSAFAGYRDDFNNVDDAQEILLESLFDNIITQSDPIIKGPIKDNNQFVLINIIPYDETLKGVGQDFLNMNTNSYSILSHELIKILGSDGFSRYKNNNLNKDDYKSIMEYFNTDRIYSFNINLKKTEINNLLYSGLTFNLIEKPNYIPKLVRYFENFRIEKNSNFSKSILLNIIFYFITLLILLVGFNNIKRNKFSFNKENLISDSIIIIAIFISTIISIYSLRLISPDINAFIGEFYTKLWISCLIIIPTIISIVVTTLLHTKFSKSVSTDIKSKNKVLFASLVSPIIMCVFFINYSKINNDFTILIIALMLMLMLIYPTKLMALIIHKFQNKGVVKLPFIITSIIILFTCFTSEILFVMESNYVIASSLLLIPLSIIGYKISRSQTDNLIIVDEKELEALVNPDEYIREGLNIDEITEDINEFIKNDIDLVYTLKGDSNIGKTRFLKEYMSENSFNNEFFFGDFDEFKEGAILLYEPFYQAFCLHPNYELRLDKGFFTNRTKTFDAMTKVVQVASASAPIDLGSLISIDDNESLSVSEISGELLNIIIGYAESHRKKMVIILDDFQWVDEATNELLLAFIDKLIKRGKVSSHIKIIITISNYDHSIKDQNLLLKNCYEELKNISHGRLKENSLIQKNANQFLNQLFKESGFKYFKDKSNIKFSQNLKIHLKKVIDQNHESFNPGNLFNYILALNKYDLILIENNLLRLIKEPGDDFKYEDSIQLLMKTKFNNLEEVEKKIIESAAYIGLKFDASILSYIWKLDLIEIIHVLEKIEDLGIIVDESENDNLYSFTNKYFHKWLRSNYKGLNRTEHSQKVIEFQKRIIDSIISKGELYINKLDVDILKSISNRCNLYKHIDEINIHGIRFNLITAEKLANQNKLKQSGQYFMNIKDDLLIINQEHIEIILETLNSYLDFSSGLDVIDKEVTINSNNVYFLDILFETLLTKSNKKQRSKAVLYYLIDCFKRNFKSFSDYEKNGLLDFEKNRFERFKSINKYRSFIHENDLLRADFYFSMLEDRYNYIPLINFRKSAIADRNFELAFEIGIELTKIFNHEDTVDTMMSFCLDSLYILSNEESKLSVQDKHIDFEGVYDIIINIFSDTNISLAKAKKTSLIIRRYVEAYFIKKEYENVIKLTDLSESLNLRIGNDQILFSNWPFAGASSLFLERFDVAEEYYLKHFDLLIKRGAKKEDFMHPLDGILHCCQIKNDFKIFDKINEILYEHLLYISDKMLHQVFEDSKIDPKTILSDLYNPVREKKKVVNIEQNPEETLELSKDIFKIIYVISKSDGNIDSSELYDLIESVNAINYSIGHKYKITKDVIASLRKEIDEINSDKYETYFKNMCIDISQKHDHNTLKSIYHFCVDIAKSDGFIDESEQILLNIAKKYFVNYENI